MFFGFFDSVPNCFKVLVCLIRILSQSQFCFLLNIHSFLHTTDYNFNFPTFKEFIIVDDNLQTSLVFFGLPLEIFAFCIYSMITLSLYRSLMGNNNSVGSNRFFPRLLTWQQSASKLLLQGSCHVLFLGQNMFYSRSGFQS